MREETHSFDFVVVGGGMAGMIAAIAAARHGANTALIHDRSVLGGNASSEIRMHICGAHGKDNHETGILEEILLENTYRNNLPNYSIWDSVLYGRTQYQENLELFLNCSVNDCTMDGSHIESVRAWQLTTETWHTIKGDNFADCSGDGILAPLSGAEFRIGREARSEFNESIAPVDPDSKTMGMSCLIQAREYDKPQPFISPDWAYEFKTPADMRGRQCNLRKTNFWWMEVGGEQDSIHDTERLREDLVKISFGVWNYIKNHSPEKDQFEHWALDWMGFLPGKRESRRYVGDHMLTQNDVEAEGRFDDMVAYGGWTMDDHFPAGFYHPEAGTIHHPSPSPYGIPYRTLYSKNIDNLFCAGRCHSATHTAMSSTRVMATTSIMGQSVGTAAALAARHGATPRGVHKHHIRELQETLLDDDCYLPWHERPIPELSRSAELSAPNGDVQALRNGIDRALGDVDNGWRGPLGSELTYRFDGNRSIAAARLVFDSNFPKRGINNMVHSYPLDSGGWSAPETLVKAFRLEALQSDGSWQTVFREDNNYQRLVRVPLGLDAKAIRLIPETTWGSEDCHVFGFDVT